MLDTLPSGNMRILVIDDNPSIHDDFRKVLTPAEALSTDLAAAKASLFGSAAPPVSALPAAELSAALQGRDGLELVQQARAEGKPFAVAFVDMRMPPGWDGLDTIAHLWEADPDLQTVICTAYSDYSHAEIIQRLGNSDRLLILRKPFDPIEIAQLAQALFVKWAQKRETDSIQTELERIVGERTAALHHLALHDRLTGLPNRILLLEHLANALERWQRDPVRHRFAAMFIDLDHFKVINDSLGHETGDRLLVRVAELLNQAMHETDPTLPCEMVARLGGDEFVVLTGDIPDDMALDHLASHFLKLLNQPILLDGQLLHTTASIGVAISDQRYQKPVDILRDADTAMYRAKSEGRGRYVLFDDHMHQEMLRHLEMKSALMLALDQNQFVVHYQPIFHQTRGFEGFEALVRWMHPQRGMIAPDEFIPVAEDLRLIHRIDIQVVNEVCRQMRHWIDQALPHDGFFVSVNLSRQDLENADTLPAITQALAEHRIPPHRLALEITESAAIRNPHAVRNTLVGLRELGTRIFLDDFGSGYSSLSCLHQLPLDGLKIDRAFIHDLADHQDLAVVLRCILDIARSYKLKVVAEGIEFPEQHEALQALGCECFQGFFFSRPVDAGNARSFLQQPPLSLPRSQTHAA